ncbi:SDR family oxidoreductase [Nitratireductor sp. XY-223]|uniref:SDR family NAD(P)-dependent oxidoreductase n=1 Tax=Nitratireductor sp. XY-223 TaxID=2561926 RepID=UPI0010AA264D|nr:SDR family oxidoreductase [Nitratireductor sp. XY-223]
MDLLINDKVAIVTGASAGIGLAVARELAAAGVKLVLTARGEERLSQAVGSIQQQGGRVIGVPLDVTQADAGDQLVRAASEKFGGADIVVNNAGRAHPGGLLDNGDEEWRKMEDIKLHAMIRLNRAAIPVMTERGWGRIVNMSSIGGIFPNPKLLISHVLSAAINNLTRGLAREVANRNILVNAVAIGAVRTENWEDNMIPKARQTRPDLAGLSDEELIARLGAEDTPVGRFGRPEEIAAIAAFLASDRNGFVTGCTVEASGGAERFF